MDGGWEEPAPDVVRCRLPRWDATAGAVAGPAGVLLIDTGASLRQGAELRRRVRDRFGRPVTHIALTHPHFDHVLGTAAFAGAEVHGPAGIAARLRGAGRDELRADAVRHGLDPDAAAEAADVLVAPRHAVSGTYPLDLGGGREVLLVELGAAHSAHDMAVYVPGRPAVVFCGDLVEESGPPQAGPDADPARWPAALDRLLELGGRAAVYVPGHGALVDADFVRAQRDELARRVG